MPKYRSYHKEIQNVTAQLLDIFNDVSIDRRNSAGVVQQVLRVPCLYGGRSRILKSLENRTKVMRLPVSAITITGISRDASRAMAVHDGLMQQDGGAGYNYLKNTPVPINITYQLISLAKFQEDMDQIMSNFVPFFNNELYVVVPHPVNAGQYMKPQVVWGGDLSVRYPEEIDKNTPHRIEMTTNFTVRTWMFPGLTQDDGSGKLIRRINFNAGIGWDVDGVGRLQGFWPVPTDASFGNFANNIVCGFVDLRYSDQLQISAGVSGYWHDISGIVSGDYLGIQVSGDPCFAITTDGGMLLLTDRCYLPRNLKDISIENYWAYYQSCMTGDLRDYQITSGVTINN